MIDDTVATPFGRRTISLVMRSSDLAAKACPPEAIADRWRLMKSLVTARQRLGLAAGALVVLEALLSCLPDTVMTAGQDLLVYPSNEQLSKRSKGMEPRSIRRHIAALVDAGLIVRRDSPNGKRYAIRARGGEVVEAYGFDLGPLLAQATTISALADEVERETRKIDAHRRQITILRRYVRQAVAFAYERNLEGAWSDVEAQLRSLSGSLRSIALTEAERLHAGLRSLAATVDMLLDVRSESSNESANDGVNDVSGVSSPLVGLA
jgi:replication initiation protein RepC